MECMFKGGSLSAPATHGDLFPHPHPNATRQDLNFLLAKRFVSLLKGVVEESDKVHGFQYPGLPRSHRIYRWY
jgi:hypothetical protein